MDVKQIVIIVFVLLVVVYLIINAYSQTAHLTKMAAGKEVQIIKASKLKNKNNSSNFTYSMWIYVDDWNYNFGQEKMVLDRSNSPTVVLGDKPNTLKVYMNYYDSAKTSLTSSSSSDPSPAAPMNAATSAACTACASGYTCACDSCNNGIPDDDVTDADDEATLAALSASSSNANTKVNTCLIENIPIQKWVNVIVSLYGRTLDIYLDGKLVRTCIMPGVPKVNNIADLQVTNKGGFSGWTSNFTFWSNASNPQEAYNIYKSGFGGSILGNALNKYRVQVSMIKDNVEQTSFQI
jgi:hypothetical protein